MGFYSFFGVDRPFDLRCTLVTSNVISPTALAVFRLVVAIYTLVATIFMIIWESVVTHDVDRFFSYFTHLSYIGLISYFWASSVQTFSYVSRGRRGLKLSYALQEWGPFLQLLHVWLTATVYVAPFIVTVVFWALLAQGAFDNTYDTWANISVHVLNSIFALSEICLSRCVPGWSSIPILLLMGALYVGLAYITYATQHFYTYSFLNPSKEHAFVAVYVLGILLSTIVVLALVKGVCALRDKVFRNRWAEDSPETEMDYVDVGTPSFKA